jgi:hypothetical protein
MYIYGAGREHEYNPSMIERKRRLAGKTQYTMHSLYSQGEVLDENRVDY